jgi:hypothetical protein
VPIVQRTKSTRRVPDPLRVLLSDSVRVFADGRIEGLTRVARKLIEIMGLDDPAYRERRRLIHRIVTLAERRDVVLYRMLLGFPEHLPNLARLRPPQNSRPQGIKKSYYAQKIAGTLPSTY